MPQSVTISRTDAAVNHISVNPDVLDVTGDTITFVNDLNPSQPVEITFYRNARKKMDNDPVKDFCDEGLDVITVPASSTKTCDVRNGINNREYLYKISAPEYVTLDPVVILDRPGKTFFLQDISPGFLFAVAAITAIAAFGIGTLVGRRSAAGKQGATR